MSLQEEKVEEILLKHFPHAYCEESEFNDNIIFVDCYFDKSCIEYISFPFTMENFYRSNPYDIVNSIWEYIAKYML